MGATHPYPSPQRWGLAAVVVLERRHESSSPESVDRSGKGSIPGCKFCSLKAATTSLFLTFYIRMAAHFKCEILYS
jgi:hypothetical protein